MCESFVAARWFVAFIQHFVVTTTLDEPVVYSKLAATVCFIAADLCVVVMVWTRVQGTWQVATESYAGVVAASGDMARGHRIRCVPYLFQPRGSGDMATGHRNRIACSGRGGHGLRPQKPSAFHLAVVGTWLEATANHLERYRQGSGMRPMSLLVADCSAARPLRKLQKRLEEVGWWGLQ